MHIVTGELRKAPRILDNGTYVVELSESYKNRENQREYTNYTFFFNPKTDGLKRWYSEAFQVGKVISVSFDAARIVSREHDGKTYLSIQPAGFPNLIFSQFGGSEQSGGNSGGWGQPQQPQQQQQRQAQQRQQQQKSNDTPMDFDDDIPFAPIGLQYGKVSIYAL